MHSQLIQSKTDSFDSCAYPNCNYNYSPQGYQKVSAWTQQSVTWVASCVLSTAIRGGGTVLQQIRRVGESPVSIALIKEQKRQTTTAKSRL